MFLFLSLQGDSEKIIWDENRPLTWDDFRGSVPKNVNFVASTNTGVAFGYSYTNTNGKIEVNYTVESFINPKKSWYQTDLVNDYILEHEQTHFDISELHARLLLKKLSEKKFTKRIKIEIEQIYHQNESQRRVMQAKYDAETNHSRNEAKEIFWRKYIANQLKKYESWN